LKNRHALLQLIAEQCATQSCLQYACSTQNSRADVNNEDADKGQRSFDGIFDALKMDSWMRARKEHITDQDDISRACDNSEFSNAFCFDAWLPSCCTSLCRSFFCSSLCRRIRMQIARIWRAVGRRHLKGFFNIRIRHSILPTVHARLLVCLPQERVVCSSGSMRSQCQQFILTFLRLPASLFDVQS